jgi:hypothetical protein
MPKIRRPPPAGILHQLIERYRDGRTSVEDFMALKHWLESDPDVPAGRWYKKFRTFTLAGEGDLPKTFLTPGMAPLGEEVS